MQLDSLVCANTSSHEFSFWYSLVRFKTFLNLKRDLPIVYALPRKLALTELKTLRRFNQDGMLLWLTLPKQSRPFCCRSSSFLWWLMGLVLGWKLDTLVDANTKFCVSNLHRLFQLSIICQQKPTPVVVVASTVAKPVLYLLQGEVQIVSEVFGFGATL